MKTILHSYSYDTNKPEDREPWYQLELKLRNTPGRGHKMHALKGPHDFNPAPGEIELEPEHLFQNQWNANVGRVFDWYEEAVFSPYNGKERNNIKRGHYLDITPEMLAIRRDTLACRYTGNQFPISSFPGGSYRFNTTHDALGSCYLKESELYLCRLLPVCDSSSPAQLTDAEREYLLPLYIAAQTKTNGAKREKQLAEIKADYEKANALALTERDGKLWLMEKGIPLENCIFYDHTKTFSFGWRSPFTGEAKEVLKKSLAEFPFQYELK